MGCSSRENIYNLLPGILSEEDNADNFKKLLDVTSYIKEINDTMNEQLGKSLNIHELSGSKLDRYGKVNYIYRPRNMNDADYKIYIMSNIATRSVATTIPALTNILRSNGLAHATIKDSANQSGAVMIVTTHNSKDVTESKRLLEHALPAGVEFIQEVYAEDTWQDIKDINTDWAQVKSDYEAW